MAQLTPTVRIPWLLAGLFIIAAACVCAGLMISTDQWARWFAHPHRQPLPETTRQGAAFWRTMLVVVSGVILIVPALHVRFCRPREAIAATRGVARTSERWLLIGIVVLAVALRAGRIGESLWYDEIAALGSFAIHGPGPIIANYYDPANHILHTLLTWVSMSLLESITGLELALRMPALLASLAAIITCHGLARTTHGPRVAILAALLSSILPVFLLEGVEARGYSMMILFAAAGTWSLIAALRDDRPRQWLGYATLSTAGAWAHPMTIFVPLGHAAWMVCMSVRVRSLHRLAMFVLASILATALALTLYAPALPDLFRLRSMITASASDQPKLIGPEGWHALLQLGGSWTWWASAPGLVLACLGLVISMRCHSSNLASNDEPRPVPASRDAMTLMWIGLPLLVIVVLVSGAWCYARFMLFAMPAAVVSMAIGIDHLWRRRPLFGWLAVGVIIVASGLDVALLPAKQPLRDAAHFIRSQSPPNVRVLVIGLGHPVMDIYSERLQLSYTAPLGSDLAQCFEAQPTNERPRWVIMFYPDSVSPEVFEQLRRQGFEQEARFPGWVDWGRGDVVVFRDLSLTERISD